MKDARRLKHCIVTRNAKSAFGNRKNRPGLKQEHEEALLDDQARTDYLAQKAKDDSKAAIMAASLGGGEEQRRNNNERPHR